MFSILVFMSVSVWEKESFYATNDVLVVGSGLLGLWTARELKIKSPNLKVTLIDQSTIPQGASTRNAGFACFGSPSELLHDANLMGEDAVWQVAEMRYKGISKIKQVLGLAAIGYDDCGGYECFDDGYPKNWSAFTDELQWLNKGMQRITGSKNTFVIADKKLTRQGLQGFSHLIENNLEGGLHSGMLVQALIKMVTQLGVTLLNGIAYNSHVQQQQYITVRTSNGLQLKTQKLLLATNAFLSAQLPQLDIQPARGQILLSPSIPSLALKGTFHYDGGYYYFRNLGNRILLGGARNTDFAAEQTLELQTSANIQAALYRFLQKHVPAVKDIALQDYSSWAGLMAIHKSKQPVLQQISENVLAAMCCNGIGVALSPVFAEQVATALL